jgi:phytoene dehydrogenase-like protein
MPSFDAIIVGGGTNGLACATRLAQAGRRVIVLEAADRMGGAAAGHDFAPGYRAPGLAHVLHMLDARVARDMKLSSHGLKTSPLGTTGLAADGRHLSLDGAGTDSPDAAAWARLHAQLGRFAGALAPFRAMTPPRPAAGAGNQTLELARRGLGLRGLGQADFREFLRMILINVADVLDDSLTDDRLKGLVAFDTTLGAWLGPRSPNSLILLLNRMTGDAPAYPLGGMGAVADAMTKAAEAAGVTLRTGAEVARLTVREDRVIGVELTDGTFIDAPDVVSAIHPRTTFETLAGPAHLDTGFLRRSRAIRSRGGAAKLHLALTGTPDFAGADLKRRLVIAPSIRTVEEAFNAVKYGEVPKDPVMEIVLPSAHEPGLAPDGHHVLSAIVQFAPHAPSDPKAARAAMLENTLKVLEAQAPGLRKLVAHAEMLMPNDIAEKYRMPGGNWHHGELAVEQMLFLRPVVGAAQYATPLPGLWLGGAGSHPGGGISGASGWNAAGQLLRKGAA